MLALLGSLVSRLALYMEVEMVAFFVLELHFCGV